MFLLSSLHWNASSLKVSVSSCPQHRLHCIFSRKELTQVRQRRAAKEKTSKLSQDKIDCALRDLDAKKGDSRKAKQSLSRVTRKLGRLTGSLHQTREAMQKASHETSIMGPRKMNQLSDKVEALRLEHGALFSESAAANQRLQELALSSTSRGQSVSASASQKPDSSREKKLHNFEMQAVNLQMSLRSAEQSLAQYDIAAKASLELKEQTVQMNALLESQKLTDKACKESTRELTRLTAERDQHATTRDHLCQQQKKLTIPNSSLLPIVARQARLQREPQPENASSSRDAAIASLTDGVSIYGSIAQLCRCQSVAAYVPLHLILQHSLSNDIVVQSRDAALLVGGCFSTKRLGRVTCRILDELLEESQCEQRMWPGMRCILDDVECSGTFSPLFRKLLGSWYICESIATALEFLRKNPVFQGNIATHTGVLCYRGGREIRQFSRFEVDALFEKLSQSRSTIFLCNAEKLKSRNYDNDTHKEHTSHLDTVAKLQANINEVNRLYQSCAKNLKVAQQRRSELKAAAQDIATSIRTLQTSMKDKEPLLFVCFDDAKSEHFQNLTRRDVSARVQQLRAELASVSKNRMEQRQSQVSAAEIQQEKCHELESALKICAFKLQDFQEQQKRVGSSLREAVARMKTLKACQQLLQQHVDGVTLLFRKLVYDMGVSGGCTVVGLS